MKYALGRPLRAQILALREEQFARQLIAQVSKLKVRPRTRN